MQPLRREGQEGAEDHLQPVNDLQGDVDARGRRRSVGLDPFPGFLLVEVAIGFMRQRHRFRQRGLELAECDQFAHALESCLHLCQQRCVRVVQLARLRHAGVEALVGEAQHAVGQVAPGGHQFVVVATQELLPGEVHILRIGGVDGQHVAQRVGIVAAEEVRDGYAPTAAGGELLPCHHQELVRRHVIGQVQTAIADEYPRPHDGVEGDVVLGDEVVGGNIEILPPLAPGLGVPRDLSPLFGRCQVADDGIEPDVDALIFEAFQGDGDPPGDVAGDGAAAQFAAFQLPESEVERVGPPMLLALPHPGQQRLVELLQVKEEVLCLPHFDVGAAADLAAWLAQLGGVQRVAAVIALVAPRPVVAAKGANAFHVAVGQPPLAIQAEGLPHRVAVDVAIPQQCEEHVVRRRPVVLRVRLGEEVEGEA